MDRGALRATAHWVTKESNTTEQLNNSKLLYWLYRIIIPYDYTVEVKNRFKGLDLIDRVPGELWRDVHDTVQETGIKTIPMACSPRGSSTYGIIPARILEWAAISYSRGSFPSRDQTHVSCIGRQILYHCATWDALKDGMGDGKHPWHCLTHCEWWSSVDGPSLTFSFCVQWSRNCISSEHC